jgi:two-component system C4-dicarboxylate transport response regulator DctD
MATILVVDASPSVRETIRIVLGGEHEVVAVSGLDDLPADASPALVVLGLTPQPRDDRALGAILARAVPDVPLLVLPTGRAVDVPALVPPHVPVDILPKPFDASTIRARVRALLCASQAAVAARRDEPRRHLEFPVVPRAAAALVRRVLMADVPVVWLHGELGTGAARTARALHVAAGRRGPFVALDAARLTAGALERRCVAAGDPDVSTIYVANLDRADPDVVADIGTLAEHATTTRGGAHLIVGSTLDFAELVASAAFPAELAYLVTTVPITLTPLRERPDDLPSLIEMVTHDLCARFRLEPVRYAPRAIERLRQYLWFGNLMELEAVLARTLLAHRPAVVDADQLMFLPDQTSRVGDEQIPRPVSTSVAPSSAAPRLDLEVVLGELAHELRNPMVTIKTFAQHLDSVLADPEVRARFATLTTDAISRMDGLLETLLDFARFRAPAFRPVDAQQLFDRALAEQGDELARRHVDVERNGIAPAPVDADEAQVLFAFRSLCRGLVPDLSPHTRLEVRGAERGVEIQVRTEPSTAARLSAWVDPGADADGGETPPLMWALAGTLLARNGATLSVRKGDAEATVIRVAWPSSRA